MNYLAHAVLSPPDEEIFMGNLWGDLLRPKDHSFISEAMIKGTFLHKEIDTYTDRHAHVSEMRSILRPSQGKYTPVVLDVLMDFILCKYWDRYFNVPPESFCADCYKIVRSNLHLMPVRLHVRIQRMMENRWLESCISHERMAVTLQMLQRRAKFENTMYLVMEHYDVHVTRLDELFLDFYDDLKNYISLRNAD